MASDVYDTMIEVWRKYMEERDEDPENHKDKEFDSLIDLEQCATEEISEELPEVIPEAFLWQVFDQLVGAALVMQKGATPFVGETKWKEIVHRDIHFGNLFVKPCDEGVYGSDRTADSQRPGDGIARSTKTEVRARCLRMKVLVLTRLVSASRSCRFRHGVLRSPRR